LDNLTLIKLHQLEHDKRLENTSMTEWKKIYNGIGVTAMPRYVRGLLERFYADFAPAVMIHDWDFSCLEITKANFDLANARFYSNCLILVRATKPWYSTWYWKLEAHRLAKTCHYCGWRWFIARN
jgi:hypothetical protein